MAALEETHLLRQHMRLHLPDQLRNRRPQPSLLHHQSRVQEIANRDNRAATLAYPRARRFQFLLGAHCQLLRQATCFCVRLAATLRVLPLGSAVEVLRVVVLEQYHRRFCWVFLRSARCGDRQ